MQIQLSANPVHIQPTYEQIFEPAEYAQGRVALLADIPDRLMIPPHQSARIPTPLIYTGNGQSIGLIQIHVGQKAHQNGYDEASADFGEYFLPPLGVQAKVAVTVINNSDVTLMIPPMSRLGHIEFIEMASRADDDRTATSAHEAASTAPVYLDYNPLHLDATATPAYSQTDRGILLCADIPEAQTLPAHGTIFVPTGVSLELSAGADAHLRPAADLPHEILVQNRGLSGQAEDIVHIVLTNSSAEPVSVTPGQRIASLTITDLDPRMQAAASATGAGRSAS